MLVPRNIMLCGVCQQQHSTSSERRRLPNTVFGVEQIDGMGTLECWPFMIFVVWLMTGVEYCCSRQQSRDALPGYHHNSNHGPPPLSPQAKLSKTPSRVYTLAFSLCGKERDEKNGRVLFLPIGTQKFHSWRCAAHHTTCEGYWKKIYNIRENYTIRENSVSVCPCVSRPLNIKLRPWGLWGWLEGSVRGYVNTCCYRHLLRKYYTFLGVMPPAFLFHAIQCDRIEKWV